MRTAVIFNRRRSHQLPKRNKNHPKRKQVGVKLLFYLRKGFFKIKYLSGKSLGGFPDKRDEMS